MANTSIVSGLKLVGTLTNKPPSINRYFIPASDSTAVGVGDPVKLAGSADSKYGVPTVAKDAATNIELIGVVTNVDAVDGVAAASHNAYRTHRPASTAMYVWVCDDPDAIYETQEDAVGGALAVTDIGLNADMVDAGVNATTGLSGIQLDTSTKATTATLSLKILGFVSKPDNEIGSANAKVRVMLNLPHLRQADGV